MTEASDPPVVLLGARRDSVGLPLLGDDDLRSGVGGLEAEATSVGTGARAGEDRVEDMLLRVTCLPFFLLPLVDGVGEIGLRPCRSRMGSVAGDTLDSADSNEMSDVACDWELCRRLVRLELSWRTVILLPVESRLPAVDGLSPV